MTWTKAMLETYTFLRNGGADGSGLIRTHEEVVALLKHLISGMGEEEQDTYINNLTKDNEKKYKEIQDLKEELHRFEYSNGELMAERAKLHGQVQALSAPRPVKASNMVKTLIQAGRKIEAIQELRSYADLGLKEAKDQVEAWVEEGFSPGMKVEINKLKEHNEKHRPGADTLPSDCEYCVAENPCRTGTCDCG